MSDSDIKTFECGQTVYFMNNNRVVSGRIARVSVQSSPVDILKLDRGEPCDAQTVVTYGFRILSPSGTLISYTDLDACWVFATKQELLDSL